MNYIIRNAPKIYANIKADEIPEVPPNRFLSRGYKPKLQNDDGEPRDTRRESVRESYSRKYTYSKSGRKIKGRGFIVSVCTSSLFYIICIYLKHKLL